MSSEAMVLWTDASSDPELIAGVRAGDSAAFGVLYERHVAAARKVAATYTNASSDIDDVVSESFSRVLRALQRGDGPDLAFRAYLFTIVRRTGMDLINKGIRTKPRDDMGEFESAMGYEAASDEPALEGFEQGMVADAFKSLPERWQAVLWYTEVEKKSPRDIAPLLGLSANGVAALAYRAREALRQAYLQQHLNVSDTVDCLEANTQLGAYVRGGLSKRESTRVDSHVRSCERCAALVAELEDVNRGMRSIIAPLVLGTLGMAALEGGLPVGGAAGGVAAGSGAAGSGAAGTGAAGSGAAAGTASASGTAVTGAAASIGGVAAGAVGTASALGATTGAAGAAATAGTLSSFFAGAASLALPVAATVGIVALAATGASYLGLISGDEPGDDTPVIAESPAEPSADDDAPAVAEPTDDADQTPAMDEPDAVETIAPAAPREEAPVVADSGSSASGKGSTGQTSTGSTGGSTGPTEGGTGSTGGSTGSTGGDTGSTEGETGSTGGDTGGENGGDTGSTGGDTGSTGTASLSIGGAPLDYLSLSATDPAVSLRIANDGDGDAGDVTASIQLPDGLTFSPPPAGASAFSVVSADRLGDFLSFALDGTLTVGDWECTLNDDASTATCALTTIAAGESAELDLDLELLAPQLAQDAVTTFTVSSGGVESSYAVRTGISANDENLAAAFYATGNVAAVQVGTSLLGCTDGDNVCAQAMAFNGNAAQAKYNNNAHALVPLNTADGDVVSGTTTLSLPEGAQVAYASLEWAANHGTEDASFTGDTSAARLRVPGATEYLDITADAVTDSLDPEGRVYYQARADVTDLVAAAGAGEYSLADIALAASMDDDESDRNYLAGFTLTVVYSDEALPEARVAVYQGSEWVHAGTTPDLSFYTPQSSDVTVGLTAWDGDRGFLNDRVDIDGDTLMPYHWNGSSTSNGDSGNFGDSTAMGSIFANNMGVDAKHFRDKTVTEGVHTLTARTGADYLLLSSVTLTVAE
ncbi:sigma-70 family RNA polymerase sigma factor [Demequina sp. NBRC 110052]|uniref:sigma-70 family RNA polymerase sigma factor n=1 Tax=Demequina sp. NBRC 110052 TaxID=1570341 RepID=UPI000A07A3D0|nr:sigma-70 family RNA polymerase sigma factor [Demequina sp. NBRC 110052]